MNTRIQFSKKFEAIDPYAPDSPRSHPSLERHLFKSAVSTEMPLGRLWGRQTVVEPGLGWFHRSWLNQESRSLEHRNFLVNVWFKFQAFKRTADQFDELSVGYETTFFSSSGDPSLASRELKAWAVEHRANFRYTFTFTDRAALVTTLSGDLDSAVRGSGGLFEGGNGQFRVFF